MSDLFFFMKYVKRYIKIDNNFGKTKDDMSVIVCKFMEKDI